MTRSDRQDRGTSAPLRFLISGNERLLTILVGLSIVTAVCETFLLAAVVQAVSALGAGKDLVALNLGPVALSLQVQTLLVIAVAAALLRGVGAGSTALVGAHIAGKSRERHRRSLFDAYLRADWATQSAEKSGHFLETFSGSVNEANTTILMATQAIPAFITLLSLVVFSLVVNLVATLAIIVSGALVAVVLQPLSRTSRRASHVNADSRRATASHVAGVLAAGAEISVLGSTDGVASEGDRRIVASERAFIRAVGLRRFVSTAGQSVAFLTAAAGLLILSLGDWSIDYAAVGTVTVLMLRGVGLIQQVQVAAGSFGTMVPFINQVSASIEYYRSKAITSGSAAFPQAYDISLSNVEYAYPGTDQPAVRLQGAHFPQGGLVAIVGQSGSGKSTLMQLMLRLREPTRGRIEIGGISAAEISSQDFSAHVGYVPQNPQLVPGTISENISFYRGHVSQAQVVAAAKLASIHDDIMRFDHGYETLLDSHVDMLSGGQKQRLALARALVTTPRLLVLDEPTSALDETNEAAVMATVSQLKGAATVVIITHKESTAGYWVRVMERKPADAEPERSDGGYRGAGGTVVLDVVP